MQYFAYHFFYCKAQLCAFHRIQREFVYYMIFDGLLSINAVGGSLKYWFAFLLSCEYFLVLASLTREII